MEMESILTAITTVGFPIVCALACGIFINKSTQQAREDNKEQIKAIREDSAKREERMYQQLSNFSGSLEKFNSTLVKMDARLEKIEKECEKKS